MANLIQAQVGEFNLGEAFAIGITKALGEQLLTPLIGNGTYMSGATKLVGAFAIPKYLLKGKMGKVIGTALAVDGVEDIVNNLFSAPAQSEQSNVL